MKKQKVYRANYQQKAEVIVWFPDETLRKTPYPQKNAQWLAGEVLRIKFPDFESIDLQPVEGEVDLSQYSTPNLVASSGAKVWYCEPTQ